MDANTKIYQLKSLLAELSAQQRMLKMHRKTVRFTGERQTIEVPMKAGGHKAKIEMVKVKLDPYTASMFFKQDGCMFINGSWGYYLACRPEWNCDAIFMNTGHMLNVLYMVYGILRNRRKTKKVQYFVDNEHIFENEWSCYKAVFDYFDDEKQQ